MGVLEQWIILVVKVPAPSFNYLNNAIIALEKDVANLCGNVVPVYQSA